MTARRPSAPARIDVKITLLITGALVLVTVFIFLRRVAATVAAALTVPLSLAATAAGMWAFGFSLNNYSLMAITISVGFVVDDAIVMIENISRLREQGLSRLEAANRRLPPDRVYRGLHHAVLGGCFHPAAVHGRLARPDPA